MSTGGVYRELIIDVLCNLVYDVGWVATENSIEGWRAPMLRRFVIAPLTFFAFSGRVSSRSHCQDYCNTDGLPPLSPLSWNLFHVTHF